MAKAEKDAMHSMPNSWREREALRKFEEARNILRDALRKLSLNFNGEMVKARMAFEDKARNLVSICDYHHYLEDYTLFDLQISLDEEIAATDPRTARRTRVVRLLQRFYPFEFQ